MSNFKLRDFTVNDLEAYERLSHPDQEYHKFNGPYFPRSSVEELREQTEKWRETFKSQVPEMLQRWQLIVDAESDELIGIVTWYWRSEITNWMEIGIVIMNEQYWGKGIGYVALKEWISHLFDDYNIVRLGLTTWSGNDRMMALSEKLGMTKEATFRKARIVNGEYYDSISYGILKEEWEVEQSK